MQGDHGSRETPVDRCADRDKALASPPERGASFRTDEEPIIDSPALLLRRPAEAVGNVSPESRVETSKVGGEEGIGVGPAVRDGREEDLPEYEVIVDAQCVDRGAERDRLPSVKRTTGLQEALVPEAIRMPALHEIARGLVAHRVGRKSSVDLVIEGGLHDMPPDRAQDVSRGGLVPDVVEQETVAV